MMTMMMNGASRMLILLTVSLLASATGVFAKSSFEDIADLTDIAIGASPEHEVRFTSGKTIYVEGLVGEQWVGRSWSADGHVKTPSWESALPAFEIELKDDPAAT